MFSDDHTKDFTKSIVQRWPYKRLHKIFNIPVPQKKVVMEIKLISQQKFDFELQFLIIVRSLIFGLLEPDVEPTIFPFVRTSKFENWLN